MDVNELRRMFDRLTPPPGREAELRDQLLHDGKRRKYPMKNLKKLACAAVIAALLVTACAAAAAPGLNRWLLDYFGVAPEDSRSVELLAAGAMPLDIEVEDNGATLHVTQILRDRYFILVLMDFTAPEGTKLSKPDKPEELLSWGFSGTNHSNMTSEDIPCILDENGNIISKRGSRFDQGLTWTNAWKILDDENSEDNCLTAMLLINAASDVLQEGSSMWMPVRDLSYLDMEEMETNDGNYPYPLNKVCQYSGNWSCEVPLPQRDTGWAVQRPGVVLDGYLNGMDVTVTEVYLSPVTIQVTVEREYDSEQENYVSYARWRSVLSAKQATLTTRDGQSITLGKFRGLISDQQQSWQCRLSEVTDPEQFRGGTLTLRIGDEVCDIPLDGLTAVDPQEP